MYCVGASSFPYPQTSQAGEYASYSARGLSLDGPRIGYSDSANVVKACASPISTQLSHRRPRAGMVSVRKVEAHQVERDQMAATEKRFLNER